MLETLRSQKGVRNIDRHVDADELADILSYCMVDLEEDEMTPAQKEEYRFLKAQVDRLQDEVYKADPEPRAKEKLFYAQEDLRRFVAARRKEGVQI